MLPATAYVPFSQDTIGNLRAMVLPGATLALLEWPTIMRVLRSDMISTLQEDYIAMARAKGLTARRILLGARAETILAYLGDGDRSQHRAAHRRRCHH